MSVFDIFTKKQSALDALDSGHAFGDVDMLLSEVDGKLVPIAQENGVHVCWQCREQFVNDPASPLRMVEFNCGGHGVRIAIHSRCVKDAQKAIERRGDRPGNLVLDMSRMAQLRRFFSKATVGKKRLGEGDER